ncbi:MAG: translation initiation factor IF-3 [Parcubacteria group bacterium]|nr:translation initiation factor IF-3 [Parcubacteria group bacterium]
MRKTFRRKKFEKIDLEYRANEQIRVPEVRVIDDKNEMIGVMDTKKAIEMAYDRQMDLVEVFPKAVPPVVKFLDYGSFKYKREKLKQKQKQKMKKIDIKSIRLTIRMSEHDENIRLDQAIKFIEKGQKVKVEIALKGREHMLSAQAAEKINRFMDKLKKSNEVFDIVIESPLKKMGGKFTVVFYNKDSTV